MNINFKTKRNLIKAAIIAAMMCVTANAVAQTSSSDKLELALSKMRYWVGAGNSPADRNRATEFASLASQILEIHPKFKNLKRIKIWEEIAHHNLTVKFKRADQVIIQTPNNLKNRALKLRVTSIKKDNPAEYARTLDRQILKLIDRKLVTCELPKLHKSAEDIRRFEWLLPFQGTPQHCVRMAENLNKSFQIRKAVFGITSIEFTESLESLAQIYLWAGRTDLYNKSIGLALQLNMDGTQINNKRIGELLYLLAYPDLTNLSEKIAPLNAFDNTERNDLTFFEFNRRTGLLRLAVEIEQRTKNPDPINFGKYSISLIIEYLKYGQHSQSKIFIQDLIEYREIHFGKNDAGLFFPLLLQAQVLIKHSRGDKARIALKRAIAIRNKAFSKDDADSREADSRYQKLSKFD